MQNRKTAIVTGAGTGVGRAVATTLLGKGWNTVFCGRRQAVLDEVVAAAGQTEARALAVSCDVTREDQVDALFRTAVDTFGRVDLLFNNAGIELQDLDADRRDPGLGVERHPRREPDRFLPRAPAAPLRRHAAGSRRWAAASSTTAPISALRAAAGLGALHCHQARHHRPHQDAGARWPALRHRLRPDRHRQRADRDGAGDDVGVPQANGTIAAEAVMDVQRVADAVSAHGEPAARRQCAVHDRDGDQDAVRRAGIACRELSSHRPTCGPQII
jgi:hypothetical protein